jgi:type III secretion system low calcium response chaperone LcrH/SycD
MNSADVISDELKAEYDEIFGGLVRKIIGENLSPQDALGYSNKQVEELYSQAYHLYKTGKYSDGLTLFRTLAMCNQTEPKYFMGMAACHHLMKEYKEAVNGYTFAALLQPEDPIPHYHIADCSIHLNDSFSAMISLEMAIKRAGDIAEYKEIKERSLLALKGLQKSS